MQIKQSVPKRMTVLMKLFIPPLFLFPIISLSQTTYIPLGSEEYRLLDRMEIKLGKDSILNFSKTKPFSREAIIPLIESFFNRTFINILKRRQFLIHRLIRSNKPF